MIERIPQQVRGVLATLAGDGFEAYAVGGCVRDLLLKRDPKDWDITTNAHPDDIQKLFPDSFYENDFGTVGVKTTPFLSVGKKDREHDVIEVTTYRVESAYSDRRRPDDIQFAQTLDEDLKRRDFTMNAIALSLGGTLHDPYKGQKDLTASLIRTVGDGDERFSEDALRMMRAVRLGAELDFAIEPHTLAAITKNSFLLSHISVERMRDEFNRIVMSSYARRGIDALRDTHLLDHVLPELLTGIGVAQNHHHIYDVYEHNTRALQTCPSTKLSVRLAALLHDIGKPQAKQGADRECTFYNHEYIGERMSKKILARLKYPKKTIDHVALLVRNHMFYYSVDEVTEAAVRRIIKKVGLENMRDLLDVRVGDRLGSGTPKAMPYKLRHFQYMVDKVSNDPVSVKMLKLNGDIMIADMDFTPGPHIGAILNVLLAEVIEDKQKNTLEILSARTEELRDKDLAELKKLADTAKEKIGEKRTVDDESIKKKHWVK